MKTVRAFVLLTVAAVLLTAGLLHSKPVENDKGYLTMGTIERKDARFDQLIPKNAVIEKLADGMDWTEGPVWVPDGKFLLYSDIPKNLIWKWKEGEGKSVYMTPASYTGMKRRVGEPGSNGLTLDSDGRLVLCEHGDRRITRLAKDDHEIVLADKFE